MLQINHTQLKIEVAKIGMNRNIRFIVIWLLAISLTMLVFHYEKRNRDIVENDFFTSKEDVYVYDHMWGTRSKLGVVWPLPQHMNTTKKIFFISPRQFQITYLSGSITCPEVDAAISRYMKIIFGNNPPNKRKEWNTPYLDRLYIYLSEPCELSLNLKSSESYVLTVDDDILLSSESQWGVLRGLETFSQLVFIQQEQFAIRGTHIEDFPRFPHRGLMLDTARHYLPVEMILRNLEIMSYNKMNVLHWHLTDDQSFPIAFNSMLQISKKGAYNFPEATYSEDDVKRVVTFARMRGIRVIPEIDLPGHSAALSKSHPELMTQCFNQLTGVPDGKLGPLNPLNPDVYTFVGKLYRELQKLFPDHFLHLGGDEVPHECWYSNPAFKKFLNEKNTTEDEVHRFLMEGLIQESRKLNQRPIVWDDAFMHGYTSTPAVIEVWSPGSGSGRVLELTIANIDVIVAFPWYLDNTLNKQWKSLYAASPTMFLAKEQQSHVLGGEACMWAEHVEPSNIITEIWPLASAVAERLWSAEHILDLDDAEKRLNNFRCVMKTRNAESTPISPGYCRFDFE